uniref:Thyroglobulin type-1 domain-containing protein n=1 Tax=Zonotrichia albicollis TaxID=44394 RepID=A0A8D2N5U6_ZONAL
KSECARVSERVCEIAVQPLQASLSFPPPSLPLFCAPADRGANSPSLGEKKLKGETVGRKKKTKKGNLDVPPLPAPKENEKSYREQAKAERESREHEEPTTSEMTEETYPPKAYRPKHGRLSELKAEALKKDRRKKLTLAKFVGMAENTAHPRVVIPELRQEFELGPCRRHMEASLQELKSSQRMVPRAVHLPNCDRKGFYKRKQCKPSRGRKRGLCWCVDKYGMKLPGTDFLSGDLQCHAFDSSNVE